MKQAMRSMIVFFALCSSLVAGIHESIPTWHWCYQSIAMLQARGYLLELNVMQKPYTRGAVAQALLALETDSQVTGTSLPADAAAIVARLKKEFQRELLRITNIALADQVLPVEAGLNARYTHEQSAGGDQNGWFAARGRVSVDYRDWLTVHNSTVLDGYALDDPLYTGKTWRNMAAYAEQAYARIGKGAFTITAGRDFLVWGTGRNGTLLFSGAARPLDQLRASFEWKGLNYTFLTAQLDRMNWTDSVQTVSQGARRYLAAHRLEIGLKQGRIKLAVTEALLYSGLYREMDWTYINPFLAYYGAQINAQDKANMFGTVDVWAMPLASWQVYGSLLIDDIQVEKTGPGDLEPNEIGFIAGTKYAGLLPGLDIDAEYTRVTNRTYKTPSPWESFMYRNYPLGHPLGNDFDRIGGGITKWFGAFLWVRASASQTRHGEGSIYTPWDTPWLAYTVDEGYSEPFPTGVVETTRRMGLEVKFNPSVHWGVEAEAYGWWRANAGNVEGVSDDGVAWRVGV